MARRMMSLIGCAALAVLAGQAFGDDDCDRGGRGRGGYRGGDRGRSWVAPSRSWGVGAGFGRVVTPVSSRAFDSCRPAPVCGPVVRPVVRYEPRRYYGGSGLSIGGFYSDRNISVGVNLGSLFDRRSYRYDDCDRVSVCEPVRTVYAPSVVYAPPVRTVYADTYVTQPRTIIVPQETIVTQPVVSYQQPLPLPPVPTTVVQPAAPAPLQVATSLEAGSAALLAADYAQAVTHLRAHVREQPNDARAMRLLAVALLADNRADDAGAMVRGAYRQNTLLATEPLVPADAGLSRAGLRDLVSKASLQANRDQTASSWLLVAVLMQAEGRRELAGQMLERAKTLGLEPVIGEALAPELRE